MREHFYTLMRFSGLPIVFSFCRLNFLSCEMRNYNCSINVSAVGGIEGELTDCVLLIGNL